MANCRLSYTARCAVKSDWSAKNPGSQSLIAKVKRRIKVWIFDDLSRIFRFSVNDDHHLSHQFFQCTQICRTEITKYFAKMIHFPCRLYFVDLHPIQISCSLMTEQPLSCKNISLIFLDWFESILSRKQTMRFCRAKISLGVSRLLIVTNRQYNGNALSNLYFRCLDWSQNNVWQVSGEWTFFTLLHVCGWAANNYKEVLKHTRSNWWPIPPDYPLWLWPFPNNLLQ